MNVTLTDIAEKLKIDISSVSYALSGKGTINQDTRELVQKTAREMGYVPNRMSRGMKGLPTETVGIIASLVSVPVHVSLLGKIAALVEDNGYSVMFSDSRSIPEREERFINEFLSRGMDGLLIESYMTKAQLESVIRGRVPYVGFGRDFKGLSVVVDRRQGFAMAVEHLVKIHKRRNIAYLMDLSSKQTDKLAGYAESLSNCGIRFREEYVFRIKSEQDSADEVAKMLGLGIRAAVCTNDFIAGYLVKNLKAAGVQVPEDFAVIGYDGLERICDLVEPSLTSVKQPVDEIAHSAVALLMEKLKGNQVEESLRLVAPTLRIGKSCGC